MTGDYEVYRDCGLYRLVSLDMDREEYLPSLFINETGADILKGIKAGRTIQEMAESLSGDQTYEEVLSDITDFIRSIEKKGYRILEDR